MDEEKSGATGKKITIANFFESIKKIDKVANDALESSKLNLGKVDAATEEIENLKKIVAAIQTDIQTLQDNDKIRRDELEDRLTAQKDALEKAQLIQKQQEMKGEKGDKGDRGAPGAPGLGEDRKNTPKQGGGGILGALGQGIIGAGSIIGATLLNPFAALFGRGKSYGGMPVDKTEYASTPDKGKSGGILETLNPFARISGMFGRKKDEKKEIKDEIKSEIKDELNLTTVRNQGQVVDGNATQEQSDLMKREQELEMLIDAEYETGGKIDYDKIAELEKELEETENKLYKLSGFNQDSVNQDSVQAPAGAKVQPEKKENKLMNFIKGGGVAGFLGRKIFGKKDKEKENKSQENDTTNPESTTFSESIQYTGRLGPGLKFIVDESSLEPGVTPERAEQHYYKTQIELLEDDFRDAIVFDKMTREEAIETYGPESNLYRFKENYNNTLEYGGYELDVGKHYDFVKKSYLGGNKKDGREAPLKGEKRGVKGIIGGIADSLTGGFFDFDKRGNTGRQDFVQGTADTLTGGFFDFDKKGDTKLQDFAQGTADTLTGGFFDFDKKGNNKFQDFQQGTADTLTGGIFDFDKKGSNKLQRFQQGFMDAMTGNLTDFDRKGGKTVGPTRAITGMLDFATANMFDLDKRGGILDEIRGKKKNLRDKDGNYIGKNARKKNFQNMMDEYGPGDGVNYSSEQELDTEFDVNTGKAYVNGIEVDPMAYAEFKQLPLSEQLDKAGAFVIENRVNKIEPVIESKEKDLSSNIYKEIDNTNDAVSNLIGQNVAQTGNANDQNTSMQVPANEPQVSDAEIKSARPNIPFISVLTDKTKKEMSLTSEGSSEIAGYID